MEYDQTRMQLHIYNAIYKETDAVYSGFAKRSGRSDCAFWLLYSIRDSEDTCRQKDLCGQWTMSKQTVNSALKGLEKQGFIVLEPDVDDGKSKRIRLTSEGIRFVRQHIDPVFELEQRVLLLMGKEACAAMLDTSRRYLELLKKELSRQ